MAGQRKGKWKLVFRVRGYKGVIGLSHYFSPLLRSSQGSKGSGVVDIVTTAHTGL